MAVPGATLLLNGVSRTDKLRQNSLNVTLRTTQRSVASFVLKSADPAVFKPSRGQTVILADQNSDKFFGGTIERIVQKKVTQTLAGSSSTAIEYSCTCVSFDQLLQKRFITFIEFQDEMAGDIVAALVNSLPGDGIDVATFVDAGELISGLTMFKFVSVAAAIDEIAARINYIWWIDPDKKLHFTSKSTNVAPFALTATSKNYSNFSVDDTRANYANRIIASHHPSAKAPRSETFHGDYTSVMWNVSKPIESISSITLNDVIQTVGTLGSEGSQWYYTQGLKMIKQGISSFDFSFGFDPELATEWDVVENSAGTIARTDDYRAVYDGHYGLSVALASGAQSWVEKTVPISPDKWYFSVHFKLSSDFSLDEGQHAIIARLSRIGGGYNSDMVEVGIVKYNGRYSVALHSPVGYNPVPPLPINQLPGGWMVSEIDLEIGAWHALKIQAHQTGDFGEGSYPYFNTVIDGVTDWNCALSIPIENYLTVNKVYVGLLETLSLGRAGSIYLDSGYYDINDAGTLLTPDDVIVISYYALGENIIVVEDEAAIAERAAVEGTSGIYEIFLDRSSNTDWNAVAEEAKAQLENAKSLPRTVTFDVRDPGLLPGQLISITNAYYGINTPTDFLIDEITVKDFCGKSLVWSCKAFCSGRILDYLGFYQSLADKGSNAGVIGSYNTQSSSSGGSYGNLAEGYYKVPLTDPV